MDQLVQFSPTTVTFLFTPGRQTTTFLLLRNVSSHRVAYKMKTTQIKRYCVRPNAAIIEPGAEINVELTQQALRGLPDDLNNCRDRFLLQVARIDHVPNGTAGGEFHGYESVMDLWTSVPEDVTYKVKFGVILRKADVTEEQNLEQETRKGYGSSTAHSSPIRLDQERSEVASTSPSSVSRKCPPDAELATTPEAVSGSRSPLRTSPGFREEERDIHMPPSEVKTVTTTNPASAPIGAPSAELMTTPQQLGDSNSPTELSAESNHEVDYNSVEYARERALGIRTAPKIPLQGQDESVRQRVAVERAGELVRTIKARQKDIDIINRELSEARHRLSDARMATRPAYDVKYEVNDSSRVPYAQIAIMAIISGALLQLLV